MSKAPDSRILSVDMLRGLVIAIMAIDHARTFFHLSAFSPEDLTQTSPEIFFTRWITHICAPAFVFLSGLSAKLHAQRASLTKTELARFLVLRGLWLIAVEIIVVNFAWQFGYGFIFIQVIWAIGVSMIILAAMIYLPMRAMIIFSIATITGHNLLDPISAGAIGDFGWAWRVLHQGGWIPFPAGAPTAGVAVVYPLIPWFAVMGLGYASAGLFKKDAKERDKALLMIGGAATLGFVLLRALNVYGDPSPWAVQERGAAYTILSFLNAAKYPASLSFLLMTLGPALALLPLLERLRGPFGAFLTTFGKVPFFFYILHFFVIHFLSILWFGLAAGAWHYDVYDQSTYPDLAPNLLRVYAAAVIVVALLYFPCRWFGAFKRKHRNWVWLSYL